MSGQIGCKISLRLWHFDIYQFEFEKYLRKEKNTIFEKSTIIWNILKIHWIIVLMEGAMRDAFQDEQ